MPRDLFGSAIAGPSSPRRFRRTIVVLSFVAHVIGLSALLVVEVFAIGPLPQPHQPADFEWVPVKLADIELPPPPVRSAPARVDAEAASANAAPLVAPPSVQPETGIEQMKDSVVINNSAGIDQLHAGAVTVEPPPPAPPAPVVPVRLHSGIRAPVKTVDVRPDYPEIARRARIEGVVIIEATIGVSGEVQSARVLRSIPLLDQAATDAVRQWKFTPALLNGVPVPVIVTVTVNFKLQ
jgi:protein TonB